jgi:hypothetical protein
MLDAKALKHVYKFIGYLHGKPSKEQICTINRQHFAVARHFDDWTEVVLAAKVEFVR